MKLHSGSLLRTVPAIAVLLTLFALASSAQKQKSVNRAEATAGVPAGVKLQPMDVKRGLWKTNPPMTVAGEMPVPAEMLNRLTPEQRARMEARMKANSAAHTNAHTSRSC